MKKSLLILLGCLTTLFLVLNCQKKILKLSDGVSFDSEKNILYGKDSEQVMDFYIPHEKTTEKRDVFVMIHGGGWRGGDKFQLTLFTLAMMRQFPNMIFANVNYRLASEARYGIPNQTDDLKTAMLYLEKRLRYKPKFILFGNSAGGHLSMLYAYHFDQEKKVKAVINIVGPADLSDSGFKSYEDYAFVEKHLIDPNALTLNNSITDFASPVHWINATSAPTLSYYGTTDRVVPLSQKAILDSTLSRNNVLHESCEFNGGHLDWSKEPHDQFLINTISGFLKRLEVNKKTH
jgi:acetyl esterase/lipase